MGRRGGSRMGSRRTPRERAGRSRAAGRLAAFAFLSLPAPAPVAALSEERKEPDGRRFSWAVLLCSACMLISGVLSGPERFAL